MTISNSSITELVPQIIANFEFIRPLWLFAILPVLIVYGLKIKYGQHQNVWQQLLPSHLYQNMVISKGLGKPSRYIHMATLAWIISILAIAGPSWEKLPQAVYQTQAGKVILLDMSLSMRATDLSPNRLTRARFKAIDLIEQLNEGETGLVVYSGDAFVVSPLTDDGATLSNLIPSLSPEIMPTQGSYALTGLERATELLTSAGYKTGDIYWLTDGINFDEIQAIREFIQGTDFKVSALLVGTEEGAPIQLVDGKLLKDQRGSIVVPSINMRYFEQAMQGTDANYSVFASDNSDITKIKRKVDFEQQQQAKQVEDTTGDTLKDMGPYLVLVLLPIAAYGFRKGIMAITVVTLGSWLMFNTLMPSVALAQAPPSNEQASQKTISEPLLDKAFKNADQRGKIAFEAQAYAQANTLFKDPQWRAASAYKNGDYQSAIDLYSNLEGIENIYNKANALAKSMQLQEALDAYNKVLEQQPDHANAMQNKAIVEKLLEQQSSEQQQQESDENNQQQSDDQNSEQNDEQSQSNESEQQDSEQQSSDQQDAQQQNSQQQNNDQSSQEQQQSDDQDLSQQAQDENEQQAQQNQQQNQEQAEQNENEQSPENQRSQEQSDMTDEQKEAISNAQFSMENLSPEEQEEMQRLQMILNKVPDDPAYLLQRKMLLESHRRKNTPAPPTQENW